MIELCGTADRPVEAMERLVEHVRSPALVMSAHGALPAGRGRP
jgi:hypothetical protein